MKRSYSLTRDSVLENYYTKMPGKGKMQLQYLNISPQGIPTSSIKGKINTTNINVSLDSQGRRMRYQHWDILMDNIVSSL